MSEHIEDPEYNFSSTINKLLEGITNHEVVYDIVMKIIDKNEAIVRYWLEDGHFKVAIKS